MMTDDPTRAARPAYAQPQLLRLAHSEGTIAACSTGSNLFIGACSNNGLNASLSCNNTGITADTGCITGTTGAV